jgi:hypothetical protein
LAASRQLPHSVAAVPIRGDTMAGTPVDPD